MQHLHLEQGGPEPGQEACMLTGTESGCMNFKIKVNFSSPFPWEVSRIL